MDLTPSNAVFELPSHDSLSEGEIQLLLGPIQAEKVRLPDRSLSKHSPRNIGRTRLAIWPGLPRPELNPNYRLRTGFQD